MDDRALVLRALWRGAIVCAVDVARSPLEGAKGRMVASCCWRVCAANAARKTRSVGVVLRFRRLLWALLRGDRARWWHRPSFQRSGRTTGPTLGARLPCLMLVFSESQVFVVIWSSGLHSQ